MTIYNHDIDFSLSSIVFFFFLAWKYQAGRQRVEQIQNRICRERT